MLREQMFGSPKEDSEEWLRDPLSHPAIEARPMTQLADLPFVRGRIFSDEMRPCGR
jgi:hypothetical protein